MPNPSADEATLNSDALLPLPPRLGDFEILGMLGAGQMGVVYKARQLGMQRDVALKILPSSLAHDPDFVERFYAEARRSVKLDHPNLVRGIAVGEDRGLHYFAMELVDGESVAAVLTRRGRLAVGEAVRIGIDVARALEHAHARGLIHRDVKPGNILLTSRGEVKLVDLGLAKGIMEEAAHTNRGSVWGTPAYMAPEQARTPSHADPRSDIYGLGASLYHLLVGRKPFPGSTVEEVLAAKEAGRCESAAEANPAIPPELALVVARMLAADPAERFQSAGAVVDALERTGLAPAELHRPAQPPPVDGVRQARTLGVASRAGAGDAVLAAPAGLAASLRRRPWVWASAALASVVTAYLLTGAGGRGGSPDRQAPGAAEAKMRSQQIRVRPAIDRALVKAMSGDAPGAIALLEIAERANPNAAALRQVRRELESGVLIVLEAQGAGLAPLRTPLVLAEPLTLTAKDDYRFAIRAARPCFVYAFQTDVRPSAVALRPNERFGAARNPLEPDRWTWLPARAASGDDYWFHLDSTRGPEQLVFVAVTEPLPDPESLSARLLVRVADSRGDSAARSAPPRSAGLDEGPDGWLPAAAAQTGCFADGAVQSMVLEHR